MRRLPTALGRVVPRPERFASALRDPAVAARLGIALALTFTTCMVTGLVSHLMQEPPGWLAWPTRPVDLYRVNQGLHVLSGLASVPLLLAKLWTVYPRLFQRPVIRSAAHALERLLVALLVGGAVFQLATGTLNMAATYPWSFSFRPVHLAVAFVAYGALLVHAGQHWATARRSVTERLPRDPPGAGLTRRGFLAVVGVSTGAVVVGFAGQTVPLPGRSARWWSPFATHLPWVGPQGLPVRTSARGAGVTAVATDPAYRLEVTGAVGRPLALTLAELRALPQTTVTLPIACVEGWSAVGTWRGVALRDLLAAAGAAPGTPCRVQSLQERGSYTSSEVDRPHVEDAATLLALELEGAPLHLDHGFPCRLVAPNRPGVLQTKWVTRVEVPR